MLKSIDAGRAAIAQVPAGSAGALTLQTPVHFDPRLMPRLVAAHGALNARFATLIARLGNDAETAACAVVDCATQLHDLRRIEALWLYPVIARGVEVDDHARKQLAQLRLLMQSLARRVLRRFEELAQAIRTESHVDESAEQASAALAEYLTRNAAQIYPLYTLTNRRAGARAA